MTGRSILRRGLILLSATNVLLWAGVWILQAQARSKQNLEVRFKRGAGVPSGYRADYSFYDATATNGRCTVVRYVSANCFYCRRETPQWNKVAAHAIAAGCNLIGVVPDVASLLPSAMYGTGAKGQIIFANMEWLAGLPPVRTPTTMIFGRDSRLLWQHVGELTDDYVLSAQSMFRSMR